MSQHAKDLSVCSQCGRPEVSAGTFPLVIGVGRVCMQCGMKPVKCEACGQEVKMITSSMFQGRTLCLSDHMKEVEKYRQHIVKTFEEENQPLVTLFSKAADQGPEGYTLLAFRRARNSSHAWEAEYEKTEIFQMRCG